MHCSESPAITSRTPVSSNFSKRGRSEQIFRVSAEPIRVRYIQRFKNWTEIEKNLEKFRKYKTTVYRRSFVSFGIWSNVIFCVFVFKIYRIYRARARNIFPSLKNLFWLLPVFKEFQIRTFNFGNSDSLISYYRLQFNDFLLLEVKLIDSIL